MKELQASDRVAVYHSGGRDIGKVIRQEGDRVLVEGGGFLNPAKWVHPKQCRRLKPKKRREFWIRLEIHGCPGSYVPAVIAQMRPSDLIEDTDPRPWIHVREVFDTQKPVNEGSK